MTFRSQNRITELEGINYVRAVVQSHNSIYQDIARENDQGNDCYIEFVINNLSSNSGVFVQIKSGDSYKDQKGYKFQTDKDHIKYWNNGLYPMVGIVYDKDFKNAFWINLTEHIKSHPEILNIRYPTIRVSSLNEFSEDTFPQFCENFKSVIENYKGYENYGRSLDWFSKVNEPEICHEGLKSLYANHRDRKSMWHYVISNFGKIKATHIQENILGILSIYNSNPHVFWHSGNIKYYPPQQIIDHISMLLSTYFGENELKIMFPYLREGVNRGSFSFSIFLVIDQIQNVHEILKKIAFEKNMDPDDRNHWFWLYMHIAQYASKDEVLATTDAYLSAFPECRDDEAIQGIRENIQLGDFVPIG